jgi:hypothetical protein
MPNRRQTWPYRGAAESPPAITVTPDTTLNSGRSLAGVLRMGTAPPVGPRGVIGDGPGDTDFGMDRVTPRGFDPMGTSDMREARQESSELISRAGRRRRR